MHIFSLGMKEEKNMLNTVTPDNFNETLKGYLIRALKEADATEEERQKIFGGLRWALDEMTMEDARKEYEKYCQGLIKFESITPIVKMLKNNTAKTLKIIINW